MSLKYNGRKQAEINNVDAKENMNMQTGALLSNGEEESTKLLIRLESLSILSRLLNGADIPQCSITVDKQIRIVPTTFENVSKNAIEYSVFKFPAQVLVFYSNKNPPESVSAEVAVHPPLVKLTANPIASCKLTFQHATLSSSCQFATVPLLHKDQAVGKISFQLVYEIEAKFIIFI